MSDEIDKALAGLTKPELVKVVKTIMGQIMYPLSIARIARGVRGKTLRVKAAAAWQRYEEIQIPESKDLGPLLAAVQEKEAAYAEYERLWQLADEVEFGTKRGAAQ